MRLKNLKLHNVICLYALLFITPPSLACSSQPISAKQGMVVTEHKLASQAGIEILRAGGNAIDAAVAVGYALAVVNPCCGNIGGGGFMTIHLANGKNIFINFREKAPLKATKNMFLDKTTPTNNATQGYLSVAVPGTVLGLDTVLKKYGTLSRQKVMEPAIRLAQEGYTVTPYLAKQLGQYAKTFRTQPNVAAIFLNNDDAYQVGNKLVQQDLARTLTLIAENGADVFYHGVIAQTIVQASQNNGGILSLEDFSKYTIQESTPLQCEFRGYKILSAPPPSSGGVTLCEMLHILEYFPLSNTSYHSTDSVRDIVEAMRYAYADRNEKLGDPDFIKNPIQQLLSKEYAKQISDEIQQSFRNPILKEIAATHELTDTTHYSIIDKMGNAVAVTYTINGFFGSGVIAGDTGFFLNDEMDDFTTQPNLSNKFNLIQHEANTIQPGKRPLSSMAPTIVMKDNQVFMVIGSPGGPRIITAVLLAILNVIDYGMNIQQAVNAPRFHYQGSPNEISIEPFALPWMTRAHLLWNGYRIQSQSTWAAVEAILIDPTDHTIYGANDHRRPDGKAAGY